MRYFCFGVTYLQKYSRGGRELSILRDFARSVLSEVRNSWAFLQVYFAMRTNVDIYRDFPIANSGTIS